MNEDGVRRLGERDLCAEITAALRWWHDAGSPPLYDFGVTVHPDGQHIWLREPGNVIRRM